MASDADRLRAQRLYVESEIQQSDKGLAASCGIDRGTVKRWREAGSWETERAAYWHRCRTDTAVANAIAAQVSADSERQIGPILARADGLAILSSIAKDTAEKGTTRVMAVTRIAEIDGWSNTTDVQGIEQDNQQSRFVIRRADRAD